MFERNLMETNLYNVSGLLLPKHLSFFANALNDFMTKLKLTLK